MPVAAPTIYLLLGLKGSGKSIAGKLLEQHCNIPFLPVEAWVKALPFEPEVNNEAYLQAVFQRIEAGVRSALLEHERVSFESTGLTPYFDAMLGKLQQEFRVITIRLEAMPETCLQRVQSRNQAAHLPFTQEAVADINRQVLAKKVPAQHRIANHSNNAEALLAALLRVIQNKG